MKNEIPTVDALVLAGGDGSVINPQTPVKGMVLVAGKPMVQWVLEALRQARHIRTIAVVLPPNQDTSGWEHLADKIIFSDGQISDNIIEGVNALKASGTEGLIISVTSDIPSVTPEAIDDFIVTTVERQADISYPLVKEVDMMTAYPDTQRTFFKLREGKVTGGNAMILDSKHFDRLRELGQEVFEARKNPLKMANMVGARFALKLATGRLSTDDLEERLGKILDLRCAAILTSNASIGADVDKPEDITAVEKKLLSR
ncbi:MAG: NTP transferase domain-containing protein [Coriobacteriia bacterium]|nr:NTP transferase domain-containing protein [Coriobacteriia bacterium]MCL2745545.1 NTP transferase domain-containing protein [Coriobacteriia bacterium]MCL2870439.1 NTP transferase domain-containing protein [Coriobacteriia bacterium]